MRGLAAWWAALLILSGARAFAHSSPQSIVKLDFLEHSIHAELLVPESELAFATATDPAPFEAYLLRHVKAATPEGAPWKVEVRSVRNTSYLDHDYLQADVVMTPPAGSPVRSLVLTDDAVTHEVRSHVIVVLAQTSAAPVMLGALQHPVRTLQIDQTGAQVWTPPAITSAEYESSPTFTPDGREMYFFRANARFGDYRLLVSRCVNGAWSAPEPPSFASKLPVLEADPFVSIDGKQLYFISSRHRQTRPGEEDLDIFVVNRGAHGAWGEPQRLPEPVNSPGAELLPRLLADGRLLFGSSRDGGFGLGDIYIGTFTEGAWKVANAGPPISTPANEYEAEMSRDGKRLVVVADRGDRSHLYLFRHGESGWAESGKVPARADVFQVGPLLSPRGDRLLFAQAEGTRSGEIFLADLDVKPDTAWPPACASGQ
ncbi:MAG TPA: hypothetical protein VIV63_08815 [Steroidobacteraceae bacterium]